MGIAKPAEEGTARALRYLAVAVLTVTRFDDAQ